MSLTLLQTTLKGVGKKRTNLNKFEKQCFETKTKDEKKCTQTSDTRLVSSSTSLEWHGLVILKLIHVRFRIVQISK